MARKTDLGSYTLQMLLCSGSCSSQGTVLQTENSFFGIDFPVKQKRGQENSSTLTCRKTFFGLNRQEKLFKKAKGNPFRSPLSLNQRKKLGFLSLLGIDFKREEGTQIYMPLQISKGFREQGSPNQELHWDNLRLQLSKWEEGAEILMFILKI